MKNITTFFHRIFSTETYTRRNFLGTTYDACYCILWENGQTMVKIVHFLYILAHKSNTYVYHLTVVIYSIVHISRGFVCQVSELKRHLNAFYKPKWQANLKPLYLEHG